MSPNSPRDGKPEIPHQSPTWEDETRPAGSFPPFEDPAYASGAAGETSLNPVRAGPTQEIEARNEEQARLAPKDTEYAGHPDFSQDAAGNKPPRGIGNSEPADDFEEKTRHSEGVRPPGQSPDE